MKPQKPQQYESVLLEKIHLTKNVFFMRFALKDGASLSFIPGQYATFILDADIRRQYSLCSDPHETHSFEIVVDTTPMGPGSKFFLEKRVGDKMMCLAPLGAFGMTESPMKKVLVATGTGIAPYRSMMLDQLHNYELSSHFAQGEQMTNNPQSKTSNPSISLYWGLRHEDDIYWDSEFRTFVDQLRGFQYFLCLSKPSKSWQGLTGHVTEHVFLEEKNWETTEFYLCGNRALIEEMTTKLLERNVKKEQIKTDLFY